MFDGDIVPLSAAVEYGEPQSIIGVHILVFDLPPDSIGGVDKSYKWMRANGIGKPESDVLLVSYDRQRASWFYKLNPCVCPASAHHHPSWFDSDGHDGHLSRLRFESPWFTEARVHDTYWLSSAQDGASDTVGM